MARGVLIWLQMCPLAGHGGFRSVSLLLPPLGWSDTLRTGRESLVAGFATHLPGLAGQAGPRMKFGLGAGSGGSCPPECFLCRAPSIRASAAGEARKTLMVTTIATMNTAALSVKNAASHKAVASTIAHTDDLTSLFTGGRAGVQAALR